MAANPSIKEFVKAFGHHWFGSMSGGGGVIAAAAAAGLDWSNAQTLGCAALVAFLIGGYMAWRDERQRVVALDKAEQRETIRAALATYRQLGVSLRNQPTSKAFTLDEWNQWGSATGEWNTNVIQTIRAVSEPDAIWFSVMDIMQPARIPCLLADGVDEHTVARLFQLHVERLVRLNQLITGEKGNVCP